MAKFVFILEQTLGHAAHGRNIERALAREAWIEPTVIRIPYRPPHRMTPPGLRNWSVRASWTARRALLKRIRSDRVDAIFIHTQVAALLATPAMHHAPTVVSLDATPLNFDTQGTAYGHSRASELVEALKRRINVRTFSQAHALVSWCAWAARSLTADYGVDPERIHVIRPGVDLNLFMPSSRLAEDGGPARILFVGGDFVRKGGPDLLAAASRFGNKVELDLVTHQDIGEVPSNVVCRVHRWLGPQSPELIALYRQADIFALPSRGDCFPQAVAEAMATGLPVVATRVGAIDEMVRDGENGYLVPPASPLLLGRALSALIEHPILRRSMGRQSRVFAEREHDAGRNSQLIFRLMSDLGTVEPLARRTA